MTNPDMACQEFARTVVTRMRGFDDGVDAAQIAEGIVSMLRAIDDTLHPIVGKRGVSGLFARSLHLASAAHPWLNGGGEIVRSDVDLTVLQSLIAEQTKANAAAAGETLLQTFYALLASLVGSSLTERLLRTISASSSSGYPARDSSS